MTPAALAALHARCFAAHPRPWSATEITRLLNSPPNFLLDLPQGFLIGRPSPVEDFMRILQPH